MIIFTMLCSLFCSLSVSLYADEKSFVLSERDMIKEAIKYVNLFKKYDNRNARMVAQEIAQREKNIYALQFSLDSLRTEKNIHLTQLQKLEEKESLFGKIKLEKWDALRLLDRLNKKRADIATIISQCDKQIAEQEQKLAELQSQEEQEKTAQLKEKHTLLKQKEDTLKALRAPNGDTLMHIFVQNVSLARSSKEVHDFVTQYAAVVSNAINLNGNMSTNSVFVNNQEMTASAQYQTYKESVCNENSAKFNPGACSRCIYFEHLMQHNI